MLWCLTTSQVLQMSRNFLPLALVQWGQSWWLRSQKKTNISFSSFKTYHHGGQKRVIDISFYFPALLLLIELESVLEKKVYNTYVYLLQWKIPKETNIFQVLLSDAGLLFMSEIFFSIQTQLLYYTYLVPLIEAIWNVTTSFYSSLQLRRIL